MEEVIDFFVEKIYTIFLDNLISKHFFERNSWRIDRFLNVRLSSDLNPNDEFKISAYITQKSELTGVVWAIFFWAGGSM